MHQRKKSNIDSNKQDKIWKFKRQKKPRLFNSLIYKITKYLPFSRPTKFMLFSEMSWFFRRMAFENANFDDARTKYIPWIRKNKFIIDRLELHHSVADLGCGEGEFARSIASHVNSVIGVDYDDKVLALAETLTHESNISYSNRDIFSLLAESSLQCDVAICSHIVEHLDEPIDFLKRCKEHFKLIFFEVPDSDQEEHTFLRELNGLDPLYSDDDHIWEFKRSDVHQIFKDLQLEILEQEYINGAMRFWLKSQHSAGDFQAKL